MACRIASRLSGATYPLPFITRETAATDTPAAAATSFMVTFFMALPHQRKILYKQYNTRKNVKKDVN